MNGCITPIENAFECIGLHQCSLLMRYLFVETMAGKALFALGLILSVMRALNRMNMKIIFHYWLIFFISLILIVIPRENFKIMPSIMEKFGYTGIQTQDILKKAGIDPLIVSPVLSIIVRSMSVLTNGTIEVMDRIKVHNVSFLRVPFSAVKRWLLVRERITQGIQDPLLKEQLLHFYQDHYYLALKAFIKSRSLPTDMLWPGDTEIMALYSVEGRGQWDTLRGALYDWLNQDGIIEYIAVNYYEGGSLVDGAVRGLIHADRMKDPLGYSVLSFEGRELLTYDREADSAAYRDILNRLVRWFMWGYSFVYGVSLLAIWIIFPFVLIVLMLSGDIGIVVGFLKSLFLLKLLPISWAVVDKVSVLSFDISHVLGGGRVIFWEMPLVGIMVILGMSLSVGVVIFLMVASQKKGLV